MIRGARASFRRDRPVFFLQFLEAHAGLLKNGIEQLLNGFPLQVRIEPFRKLKIDFYIRLATVHRDRFIDGLQRNPPAPYAVFFQECGGRKNNVGILRGWSHEKIDRRDEIELLKGLAPFLRFETDAGNDVARLHPKRFYRIGLPAENLIEDGIRLRAPDEFPERPVCTGADARLVGFFGMQLDDSLRAGKRIRDTFKCVARNNISSRNFKIPSDAPEDRNGLGRRRNAGSGVYRQSPVYGGRLALREKAGRRLNVLLWDPGISATRSSGYCSTSARSASHTVLHSTFVPLSRSNINLPLKDGLGLPDRYTAFPESQTAAHCFSPSQTTKFSWSPPLMRSDWRSNLRNRFL